MTGVIGIPYNKHAPPHTSTTWPIRASHKAEAEWDEESRMKRNAMWNTVEPLYNEHA